MKIQLQALCLFGRVLILLLRCQTDIKSYCTKIPSTYSIAVAVCDDFLDVDSGRNVNNNKRDGITFDLSYANNNQNLCSNNQVVYNINYYRNQRPML
jgi:hypothetical protein